MFSSFSTRDRLRRSMSTRSMRKGQRVSETEPVDPHVAKVLATSAASHAMRSSGRSSTDSKTSYDRLGGPRNVAVPKRRPNSTLQWAEDSSSIAGASIPLPVTPRQSVETSRTTKSQCIEDPAALPPIVEFKGLDGRDSSVPSSYRRLRKARSMFSTRQNQSPVQYGTPPLPHQEFSDPSRSPRFELPRTMRHSMSFIRGSNRQGSQLHRRAKSQDAAIQLARSQFLEDSGSISPHVRHSSLFLYRRKREHKPFRKTFRVTSEGAINAGSPSGQPNPRSPYSKSRTFSASIRRGLRRVFGRTNPIDQSSDFQGESDSVAPTEVLPTQAACDESNVPELTPPRVIAKGCLRNSDALPASRPSPSRDSPCTSTSRVTSWADSTVANTVTNRKNGHRQSLSLIEEHGDLNEQLPLVSSATFTGPQTPTRKRPMARGSNRLANGHDLYLALMQQIGQATEHSDEEVVLGTVPKYQVIPERTSSAYSHRSRRTIRHVPSAESSASPGSFATARGDSLTPQRHTRSIRYFPLSKASRFPPGQENDLPPVGHASGKSPRSAYVISEESDNDTGSVVITRLGESKIREISPTSIYSRTTGDATPPNNFNDCVVGSLCVGEPGTATIFDSQRTTYSSPTRTSKAIPSETRAQSSADWQRWVSSQIERIEKASPIREHLREDAQLQDDDGVFTDIIKRAPTTAPEASFLPHGDSDQERTGAHPPEPKAWTQNNFSRPFSRSSSIRTILSSQKVEPDSVGTNNSRQPCSDIPPVLTGNAPSLAGQITGGLSPMRLRNANLVQLPDSPTTHRAHAEMQKRPWTQEQYRRYSARRPMANAASTQFRSMRSYRDARGLNNENTKQQDEHEDMLNDYHKFKDAQSTISSKDMVEAFLSSRRRRTNTGKPESVGINEAFL